MPKAYAFLEYGGPEVQTFLEVPKPVAGPGQLVVAVRAAGVNPVDWKLRAGYLQEFFPVTFPAILGQEVAGVVEQVGEGVDGFSVGDEVFGQVLGGGGFAEYAVLSAQTVAHKPAQVSFTDAATLPVASATAYDGLQQLGAQAGQTLLVIGVGGGVGVAAAQLARSRGATVIGTASAGKKEFVESLGVVHVPYGEGEVERLRAIAPNGVDAVYDLVGGEALTLVASLVRDPSKLITAIDPVTASQVGGSMVERTFSREVLEELAGLVQSGVLDPLVTEVFPFEHAAQALSAVESGHARGKKVLVVR